MYSLIKGALRADNTSASDSQSIITVLVTRTTYKVRLSNEVFDKILLFLFKCFSSLETLHKSLSDKTFVRKGG